MPIELRIQSGSRAGQTQSFDKSVIAIGRHPLSDLRFDPNVDIDVSTRHGEIRQLDDRYVVLDNESTNGTFVNDERLPRGGSRELKSGDVIGFGNHGPTALVTISAAPPGSSPAPSQFAGAPAAAAAARHPRRRSASAPANGSRPPFASRPACSRRR